VVVSERADDGVVTLEEYRGLLRDARAMVVALRDADVTHRPVPSGNPPLRASEIEVFDRWRHKAIENWNVIETYLQAGDAVMVRHGLNVLQEDMGYPLSDVRSDWELLAPEWASALTTFHDHLHRLQSKTAVYDRPAARDEVAAFLPTLAAEFRPVPPR
jgi:hypothetical protein